MSHAQRDVCREGGALPDHAALPDATLPNHTMPDDKMRRVVEDSLPPRSCPRVATLLEPFVPARRVVGRALRMGMVRGLPVGVHKRILLCNVIALGGTVIMAIWAAVEAAFGDRSNVPWELGFLAGFAAVLGLNAAGIHRAARLLVLVIANLCVFAGAVLFTSSAGGVLPFFAMAAMSLLLFGPGEWLLAALGAALPAALFAAYELNLAVTLLSIEPKPAPGWYFAANAATTFALAFLVPFFFLRANVRAEAALARLGQEKLKRLIDADLIGVVRGRLSGHVEDANDTFLGLLGYTRQDLEAGAIDLDMIAPCDSNGTEVHRRGPTAFYERVCVRKDGTHVPAMVGIGILDESGDEVVAFVLDLTAQKHLEAQRAMLHESREALRLRDLFNSIASHELKTPLTALVLQLQLLKRRLDKDVPPGSRLRAQVEVCERAARRMGELIHALLDVARIHRGRLTLDVRDTDVVEEVRRVVSGFEVSRDGGGQPIAVHADGSVFARLDAMRFDQVVTNLLSNAIKYGAGKPIEVRVNHDRAGDLARLEVIDHGPGIDPAVKDHIFEPFRRATSMEPIPGLGLGLYVVKLIVEGHGGKIEVDSELGRGSRFIVDFPRGGASAAALLQ